MARDFENLTAQALAAGLNRGQWSSVELTNYFLRRIKNGDSEIHAIAIRLREPALRQAAESDERRKCGQPRSVIDGLPMTIKDAFRMKGSRTTYGLRLLKFYRARHDSSLIKALRDAGVVFLGRSAVPTACFDWNCRNSVYAECVNPLDTTRTPGGSSGGSAAALTSGFTPLELGSDLGGSIRYPAHCCGVFGLRTSDGWLPVDDLGPEFSMSTFKRLVTCGPLARTAYDLKLLMDVFEKSFPIPSPGSKSETSKQVAYSESIAGVAPDSPTKKALESFLRKLSSTGAEIIETKPDLDYEGLIRAWGVIVGYEYTRAIPKIFRHNSVKSAIAANLLRPHGKGPLVDYLRAGAKATANQYESALATRAECHRMTDQFFARYPKWILPVSPSVAIPLARSGLTIKSESGSEIPYTQFLGAYLCPTVMMGTPALACPIGVDESNRMPIGVQVHGARFSDHSLVQWARQLEGQRIFLERTNL